MKANEMGKSENQTHTKTHLGHLLNIGDLALGYLFLIFTKISFLIIFNQIDLI
jgi:hypothetical protein